MPFFSSLPKPFFTPIIRSPNLPVVVHRRSFSVAALQMSSKEVKLWGGRFEESVTDAVEKFTESISFDKPFTSMGSRACSYGFARQVYTHLQRAQPVLLQHLLLAYVEQLERDASRLLDCRVRMNFCPLGACALAGTGLPIDRFMTSEALGFSAPMRNSFRSRFCFGVPLCEFHHSHPFSHRLVKNRVLWASEEFGFLSHPSDSVSTGSSIMPQKKNPDPMELVRGKSAEL
ncbi:UNVERIFIED_CONTAM: Argininosuccinate lyase, chloroplastic [Sesamum latifolium]|uniref:Argininosuccinate lyase, chloroplastic n=1 Tax=Sesamum latifolium TaxID=2727402 RepID=A0AAW2U1K6_9LAMI